MKKSIYDKLEQLAERLTELDGLLGSENATRDMDSYRKLTREHADITPVVALFDAYRVASADFSSAAEMLNDVEMKELAQAEQASATADMARLEDALQKALLPRDPNDDKNLFLEIRAGTGGDESALFAGDLFRMYSRYAERQGWRVEIISRSESDLGGFREIIARIEGRGAYSQLKFESGGHRVQRVPATESQGRIHTSACTVAVMPELPEAEMPDINPADLRIDTFRSSGAGGQHVNTTDSAIRITHLPTGIVVECQDERSQHKNKAKALSVLGARIRAAEVAKRQQAEASTRRNLLGSGDRSDRNRTYNFPQGRVTDHRINLTLYRLDEAMEGKLDMLIEPIVQEHQADQLAALSEQE